MNGNTRLAAGLAALADGSANTLVGATMFANTTSEDAPTPPCSPWPT